ncbi:ABC transporter ATP-binding protein [bacterium]|nr:ABC transporter ATP-binding protein [bacterium]
MSILEVKNVFVEYVSNNLLGKKRPVYAVNGVSFDVKRGEIFSIAGESGCGKSSLLRAVAGLIDVKSGEISFDGSDAEIQMVFQSPSLNPKMRIRDILIEPLIINRKGMPRKEMFEKVLEVIKHVGLSESDLDKYPHEFSGGQKQRISIARALILTPKILLADEPVSALDVSIQGQIINLLKKLRDEFNLTIVFISHDLNVIRYISDRVAIMYLGEIVEQGLTDEIFNDTKHPYSKALLSANPSSKAEHVALKGELPSPMDLPMGCKFNTRCSKAFPKCIENAPDNVYFSDTHFAKCHLLDSCLDEKAY